MNRIVRFAVPIVILVVTGYYVSTMFSKAGSSMAQKAIQDGIAIQVRYHQSTIKDGDACADFKARIGRVSGGDYTAQLISLSNEARSAGCLK